MKPCSTTNKYVLKNQWSWVFVVLTSFLFSCGEHTHSHDEADETHDHSELQTNIVSLNEEQTKAIDLQLGSIENKELTATIKANGMLKVPNNFRANASSLYGGVVQSIDVQVGDYVKKGQVIARITNPQFVQLQEEYLSLKSKIILADQELQRQQQLTDGGAGALKNLQAATAEYQALQARKASLQAQFRMMGIESSNISSQHIQPSLMIRSPIQGVISKVFSQIGSYVDVSAPLAEIVDNSSLHLDLQVFEKDLPLLQVGQTIHFTLTNNPTNEYDAEVFSIGASFENDSKTIPVHAKVKGNKTNLIDGMNITGIVSLSNATMPAVPNDAIVEDQGRSYIFILTEKDQQAKASQEKQPYQTFQRVEIIKGVSAMGYTAITLINAIDTHQKIVTKGAFFLNAKMTNTGEHEH
jgi:RND family efflux transporter MFP subunit